jgi:C4-dicarboxylate transporter DctM subunit
MEAVFIGFILVFVLIVVGVPIAMAFGFLAVFLAVWFQVDPSFLMPTMFIKIRSVVILAGPLFVLLGGVIHLSGLAGRLVDLVNAVLGRIRGSLGGVAVVALAIFGSITGAISAGIACIGTIMIPKMEEMGYPRGYATALVACAGVLGQLIPPSVPMIFYALLTGQSIPAVWLASVGPGILVTITYVILNYFMTRNFPLKTPPKLPLKEQTKVAFTALYRGIPVLLLPVLILGGVYGGITTPTEAAAVAVVYTFVVAGLFYRSFTLRELGRTIYKAGATAGVILVMLFFILITARVLIVETIPQQMADWVTETMASPVLVLLMINFIMLIMGMLMDDLSGTLLAATMLYPIVAAVGVSPLHFAAIVGVNLGLGCTTPPCAPMLFLAGRIGDCPAEQYMKPAMILMFSGQLPVLIITTYWPTLSLFLPALAGYVH